MKPLPFVAIGNDDICPTCFLRADDPAHDDYGVLLAHFLQKRPSSIRADISVYTADDEERRGGRR